ncbi:MAG: GNAT family N-acetyltransferase [Janthinobacterium lividum]
MTAEILAAPACTPRLLLRPWRDADKAPFRALNADPRVMEFFPATLSAAESDALADSMVAHQAAHGFCFWAVERLDTSAFIGFCGLAIPQWNCPFRPCVEIGWRLAHDQWGHGYASEAARAALRFGFETLRLAEIMAWTAAINLRSQRVMQRLAMRRVEQDDFNHPLLRAQNPLSRHAVYRLAAPTPAGS